LMFFWSNNVPNSSWRFGTASQYHGTASQYRARVAIRGLSYIAGGGPRAIDLYEPRAPACWA
jgi:hypothetical protein